MKPLDTTSIFAIPRLHKRLNNAVKKGEQAEAHALRKLLDRALHGNLDAIISTIEKRYKIIDYDHLSQNPEKLEETIREHLRILAGNTSRTKIAQAMNSSVDRVYRITGYKKRSLSLIDLEDFYKAAYKVTREDTAYFQKPKVFFDELLSFYFERVQTKNAPDVADTLSLDLNSMRRRFWKLKSNATLRTIQEGLLLIKRYEYQIQGDGYDRDVKESTGKDHGLSESRSLLGMELV